MDPGRIPVSPANAGPFPQSSSGAPQVHSAATISGQGLISTTFHPANQLHASPCDLVLNTSDSVHFYVHSAVIASISSNRFGGKLQSWQTQTFIEVVEVAPVINVVLHSIYGLSCAQFAPMLGEIGEALIALQAYGVSPIPLLAPGHPLYTLLLSYALTAPLSLYALAATYGAERLAIAASAYLLRFSPTSLTDAQAASIPPVYLKRLLNLLITRSQELTRILHAPPAPHPPTSTCGRNEQAAVRRAWSLAAASISYDARPDTPPSTVRATLEPLVDHLSCAACRSAMLERINNVLAEWAKVKNTI